MEDRRKILEAYSKQLSQGNPLAEEFLAPISETPNKWNLERIASNRALKARNLSEDALANEVLKNTGIPIPADNAPRLKKEDFLHRIIKERYPELTPDLSMGLMMDHTTPDGIYSPTENHIFLKNQPNILKNTSTALHEAGHQYDDNILKFDGTDDVQFKNLKTNAPTNKLITDVDPAQAYELIAKGHHAEIPKLREGSYGLGALKSMLKSGTFKQVAGALPVVGGLAAATMSGDASAAVPLLDEADDVGESRDEEASLIGESRGFNNYNKSQAKQDALRKLRGR